MVKYVIAPKIYLNTLTKINRYKVLIARYEGLKERTTKPVVKVKHELTITLLKDRLRKEVEVLNKYYPIYYPLF